MLFINSLIAFIFVLLVSTNGYRINRRTLSVRQNFMQLQASPIDTQWYNNINKKVSSLFISIGLLLSPITAYNSAIAATTDTSLKSQLTEYKEAIDPKTTSNSVTPTKSSTTTKTTTSTSAIPTKLAPRDITSPAEAITKSKSNSNSKAITKPTQTTSLPLQQSQKLTGTKIIEEIALENSYTKKNNGLTRINELTKDIKAARTKLNQYNKDLNKVETNIIKLEQKMKKPKNEPEVMQKYNQDKAELIKTKNEVIV